jgi:hypothetical protein
MNVNDVFPSKYLRAADLDGHEVTVTIEHIEMESLGADDDTQKPVLYFVGKKKGLGLNKTNATTIANLYSPEMDNWIGCPITLFPTQTDFQGKSVECIRVRIQKPKAQPAKAAPAPVAGMDEISEDDIPF